MEALQAGFRSIVRVLIFLIYLVFFLASSYTIHLTTRDPVRRRRRFSLHGVWWCHLACKTFGITVRVKNQPIRSEHGLLCGNHMGFIDILALASIQPNLFVTSNEMRETPLLGLLTEMGGCIYVERRNRSNIMNELGEMIQSLKIGFNVLIYPEATSTGGEGILPFKRTLLTAASHAGVPIFPFVFNYVEINGEPGFKKKYQDAVCWYGDIPFHTAIWRAFGLKSLVCEIEFLQTVYPKITDDRGEVADRLRDQIVAKFKPVHP